MWWGDKLNSRRTERKENTLLLTQKQRTIQFNYAEGKWRRDEEHKMFDSWKIHSEKKNYDIQRQKTHSSNKQTLNQSVPKAIGI